MAALKTIQKYKNEIVCKKQSGGENYIKSLCSLGDSKKSRSPIRQNLFLSVNNNSKDWAVKWPRRFNNKSTLQLSEKY